MKNLYTIPTDKPSRLVKHNDTSVLYLLTGYIKSNPAYTTQNIYITNDEKIKLNDYVIQTNFEKTNINIIKCESEFQVEIANDKDGSYTKQKIILTTDRKLITSGVQAIDDVFLQWLVKNPNCDKVDHEKEYNEERIVDGKDIGDYSYKIIIPSKEKPKQEKLKEAAHEYFKRGQLGFEKSSDTEEAFLKGGLWQQEQILQFLYSEIVERRPYSSSKMCEVIIEFIEQFKRK